jgi:hypothetical protein
MARMTVANQSLSTLASIRAKCILACGISIANMRIKQALVDINAKIAQYKFLHASTATVVLVYGSIEKLEIFVETLVNQHGCHVLVAALLTFTWLHSPIAPVFSVVCLDHSAYFTLFCAFQSRSATIVKTIHDLVRIEIHGVQTEMVLTRGKNRIVYQPIGQLCKYIGSLQCCGLG